MIRKVRLWWSSCLALRRLSLMERMIVAFERKMRKTQNILRKRRKQLVSIQKRLELVSETIMEDLEEAQSLQRQYEETVNALREENRIFSNVTLPTLTAEHTRILECLKAEISIAVRHQVIATSSDEGN